MNKKRNGSFLSLPDALHASFGGNAKVREKKRLYGGDINDAWMLTLSGGERVFMKTNRIENARFFTTEERGLEALRATKTVRVPKTLGTGVDRERGYAFLLLEYVDSAAPAKDYWETFGRQLAQMHRARTRETESGYGFPEDNYIGATPQKNSPKDSWVDFYRDCRLLPQIRMAQRYLDKGLRRKLDWLTEHLDRYIREPEFPSVVHGDLWGGNVLRGGDGRAWLIDPAAYVGDFETDLTMTELFGRFPQVFYQAYHEVNPVDPGYRERKDMYQLYHLLNHLNLFGRSYLGSVAAILQNVQIPVK